MTPEDYVSYPIALALKKAGFDWPCRDFYWTSDGIFKHTDALVHKNSEHCTTMVAAPTLAVAQKWLREKKRMIIVVTPETDIADFNDIPKEFLTGEWCYEIWVDDDTHRYGMESHSSYEQALSAGIAAALELIKKKGE